MPQLAPTRRNLGWAQSPELSRVLKIVEPTIQFGTRTPLDLNRQCPSLPRVHQREPNL